MKGNILLGLLSVAAVSVGCMNKTTTTTVTTETVDSTGQVNKPVENNPANTNYKPAFEGQTRIGGVKTKTPIESSVLTSDLKKPWGITTLPDGRFLITEKGGNMRIVTGSGVVGDAIKGIPKVDDKGQGGLLDITLDPQFEQNRMIYWTFSEKADKGNHTAVAKGKLSGDEKNIENATVIFRATPTYDGDKHYGSRILFDREGHIWISTGERSDLETRPQAQDLTSALGKVIRITREGKPVSGNPFQNDKAARPEIYSYGHRNPQGLAMHPATGDIWETEMGPRGGDELNLIRAGKNYGWPTITYGIEYSGEKIGGAITQKEGMEQPVYYWDPVISCSGMAFYDGSEIPEWKNNLFIGGLSSMHIIRLVIGNNKVVGEERLLASEGQRFRDIAQGKDGALYAITDQGKLYKIAKK
jgi:glucose/arabinose dehydrogenase